MARNADGEIDEIWADAGDTATPPVTFTEGWDVTYSQTGGPKPERTSFNFLLKQLYAMGLDISQFGASLPYSQTIDFLADAVVTEAGVLYICLLTNGPASAVKIPGAIGSETFWGSTAGAGFTGGDPIVIEDQKADGTDGGTNAIGAWTARTLNTEVTDPGGHATLAANQLTLAAGTYEIYAISPFYGVNGTRLRLQNITDVSTVFTSISMTTGGTNLISTNFPVELEGQFTIASAKTFELQYYSTVVFATHGLGRNDLAVIGVEVFSRISLRKVA